MATAPSIGLDTPLKAILTRRNRVEPVRFAAIGRRYLAAQVTVFLLFGPYFANIFDPSTRLFYMWQRSDAMWLLAGLALMAGLLVAAREVFVSIMPSCLGRLADHGFLVALGAGLLSNLWFYNQRESGYHIGQFGMEMQTLWLMLFAIVGYAYAKPQLGIVTRARQLCQILSPVMLIVALQFLSLKTYPPATDPIDPPLDPATLFPDTPDEMKTPVYLFIFDEWSYPRTFDEAGNSPQFPHLQALCRDSIVFHDAHAPGDETVQSIPGIMMQTDLPVGWVNQEIGFRHEGEPVPFDHLAPIYDVVGEAHYHEVLISWGAPFHLWLGEQIDVARSYRWYPLGQNRAESLAAHAFLATYYWTDPWFTFLHVKLKKSIKDRQLLRVHDSINADANVILQAYPPNTFAVIHHPLPHHPYILNPDGSYRGPETAAWEKPNLEGYERNLICLDRVIGQFVSTLIEAGRYEKSLLIITSDHSWRRDPLQDTGLTDEPLTHVPLIVKLPGQSDGISVDGRFETYRLGALIEYGLAKSDPNYVIDSVMSGGPLLSWSECPPRRNEYPVGYLAALSE